MMKWIGLALVAAIPLAAATAARVRRNRKGKLLRRTRREADAIGSAVRGALRRLPVTRALR